MQNILACKTTKLITLAIILFFLIVLDSYSAVQKKLDIHSIGFNARVNQRTEHLAVFGSNSLNIINPKTGNLIREVYSGDTLLFACAWTPGGGYLTSAFEDGTVRIYNKEDWNVEEVLRIAQEPLFDIAWNATGNILSCAGSDSIYFFDISQYQVKLKYPSTGIAACRWHPLSSNRVIISTFNFSQFSFKSRIVDIETNQEIFDFNDADVFSAQWSPKGKSIAGITTSGKVLIWDTVDVSQSKEVPFKNDNGIPKNFTWLNDSLLAISGGTKVCIFNANTLQEELVLDAGIDVSSFSIDDNHRYLVMTSLQETIQIREMEDIASGAVTTLSGHGDKVESLCYGDSSEIFSLGSISFQAFNREGKSTFSQHNDNNSVNTVRYNINKKQALISFGSQASSGKNVVLFSTENNQTIANLDSSRLGEFGPTDTTLTLVSDPNIISIINSSTFAIQDTAFTTLPVAALEWNAEKTLLAVRMIDGNITLYDRKLKLHSKLPQEIVNDSRYTNALAWSVDGSKIFTIRGNGSSLAWYDVALNALAVKVEFAGEKIAFLAASPVYPIIAIGTENKKVILYNYEQEKIERTIEFTKEVSSIAWSPESSEFAVGFLGGKIEKYTYNLQTSVNEDEFSQSNDFLILPNPSNEICSVQTQKSIREIQVLSPYSPEILLSEKNSNTIKTSILPNGIYYIAITFSDNTRSLQKMTVVH